MNFCNHKVEICSECLDKKVISNFSGEVSVGLLNDLQDYREKIQKLEEENKEAKDIIRQYGAAVMLGECPKRTWSVFKQASKFLSETQEKK